MMREVNLGQVQLYLFLFYRNKFMPLNKKVKLYLSQIYPIKKNYLLFSTISTISAIYSPITGIFKVTIFFKNNTSIAVTIVTPIPIPTPLNIPAIKFLFIISFLLPKYI